MTRSTITTTVEIDITPEVAATWFAGLNDEEQADFIIHVAKEFGAMPAGGGSQILYIGKHLAECECSTEAARQWVRDLASFTDHYSKGTPL